MASQLSRNRIKKVEKHWKNNIGKNIENNNGKMDWCIRGLGGNSGNEYREEYKKESRSVNVDLGLGIEKLVKF